MSVIRVKHHENYVVINKQALEDPNLSFKAKGLWSYCMSRPNDWEFHVSHLATISKDGEDSVYSALKELIDGGYVRKVQENKGKGIGSGRGSFRKVAYEIFEVPEDSNNFSQTDFPDASLPFPRNPALLSNEDNKVKKDTNNSSSSPPPTKEEEEELERRFKNRKSNEPVLSKKRWKVAVLKEIRMESREREFDLSFIALRRASILNKDSQQINGCYIRVYEDYVELSGPNFCRKVNFTDPDDIWVKYIGSLLK